MNIILRMLFTVISHIRVQELEEDLEITEQKYVLAIQKYDKSATAADDSDRMAKVLQNRATEDEAKLVGLSDELKKAQHRAEEADKKYDEAQKKMVEAEAKLEVDGERADVSEFKIIELEEELKVVANNLKSLEVSEAKSNQREKSYKEQIKSWSSKLKQAESRAEYAERSVNKLQREVILNFLNIDINILSYLLFRLTDWKMSSCWNRRNTRQSQMSWR